LSIKNVLLAVFCLLTPTTAISAEPLTDVQVKSYIKSGPEFKAWSEKNSATLKSAFQQTKLSAPEGTSGEALMEKSMAASGLSGELDALVKGYGFDSGMQYLNISQRVMRALMAQRMQEGGGASKETEARMQEALRRLEATDMPPEQKEQMRKMLQNTHSQMAVMMQAPEADIAVVKPHMSAIQKAFQMK